MGHGRNKNLEEKMNQKRIEEIKRIFTAIAGGENLEAYKWSDETVGFLLSELDRQKELIEHCANHHEWVKWNTALQKKQDKIDELEKIIKERI